MTEELDHRRYGDLLPPLEDERDRLQREVGLLPGTDHTRLYVTGAIGLCAIAAIAAVVIAIARPNDTHTVTTILGVVVPVILALMAKTQGNTHRNSNGRVRDLLAAERAIARIQGRLDPRQPRPGQRPSDQA